VKKLKKYVILIKTFKMKRLTIISVFTVFLLGSAAFIYNDIYEGTTDYKDAEKLYNSFISGDVEQQSALSMFLTQMPKGGDIHHHYTGTIYVETYLSWVKKKNWSIDKNSLRIIEKESDGKTLLSVDQLKKDNARYRKLLALWSDKDYANHYSMKPAPDQQFFNTFGYFGTVSNEYMKEGLGVVKERAVSENVQYIETMLSSVGVSKIEYPNSDVTIHKLRATKNQKKLNVILDSIDNYCFKNIAFTDTLKNYVARIKKIHQGIDDDNFTMRFQTYYTRVKDPVSVYIGVLSAFEAAKQSKLIVGVNLVAPENNAIALQDYTLHMQMFHHLKQKYKSVNIALHAGELTLGMVRPKNLTFHINQALNIGEANRIGHGVDICYETNAPEILAQMKNNNTAVEINLTSNEFILGVKCNDHPYMLYSRYGVPIVIATDDSGVSRNNLSGEYTLLASRYKPTYKTIKKYTYNSIKYSFLDDSTKNIVKKRLDNQFIAFEKQMSLLSKSMN